MSVIAGDFKGRHVEPVPGEGTRPTTDRVREAMASSVISNHEGGFEQASVLDACAGSGALGIEALSRGARHCTFVDADRKAVKTIEGNLAPLPLLSGQARVVLGDVFSLSRSSLLEGSPFDLVLLDPPYAVPSTDVEMLLKSLDDQNALASDSLVIYEKASGKGSKRKLKDALPQDVIEMTDLLGDSFLLVGVKQYGATQVVYLAKQ